MLTLTPAKEEELLNFVKERLTQIQEKKNPYDKRVYDWVRLYCSLPDNVREVWETDISIPYTFSQIASMKPRLRGGIFQRNEPFLQVQAVDKAFLEKEKAIQSMLMHEFDEMGFLRIGKDAIHDSLPKGTGWVKVVPVKCEDGITRPTLSLLDFFDVIVDFSQNGKKSNDYPDIIHRIVSSHASMRKLEKAGVYKNIDDALATSFPMDDIMDLQLKCQSAYLSIGDIGVDDKKYKSGTLNKCELMEWWGTYDIGDNGVDVPVVVTIANRMKLIRVDKNEDVEIPIFPVRLYRIPKLAFGRSICQMTEALNKEMNEKRSQRMDFLNLLLKPTLKARRTAIIDWDNLYQSPDNVIRMDDPQTDLSVMEMGRLPGAVYQEDQQLKSDIQYATGSIDMGGSLNGNVTNTATGMNMINSEGANRYTDYIDDLTMDLTEIVRYCLKLMKKYTKMTKEYRVFDSEEWVGITAKDLEGNYKIQVEFSSATLNRDARIQNLVNMLGVIGKAQGVNLNPIIRKILKLADIGEVDQILESEKDKATDANTKRLEEAAAAGQQAPTSQGPSAAPQPSLQDILSKVGPGSVLNGPPTGGIAEAMNAGMGGAGG